ncbi:hypothetical protein BKA69DRAFT_713892 [Paraphysoderma sedebokerense]|nr:hypothetical protein BKA69DRAFT_713892 [Paraphysoderma sedebokerense]
MAETVNPTVFYYFVVRMVVLSATITGVLIYWAFFVFSTPKLKKWTTPFNLGFTHLTATFLFFLSYLLGVYGYNIFAPVNSTYKTFASYFIAVADNLQATTAEICLAWMVYKVYSWKTFKIILPFIILFIVLRFAAQIWTSTMLILKLDPYVAGSVRGSILMWNLLFFSFLFIYRYRRKLKNAYKGRRFYKTVLDMSLRNAVIPTLFVFPAVITVFFTKDPEMALANTLLVIIFRLSLGLLIAHSLYIINRGERGARKKDRDSEGAKTFHVAVQPLLKVRVTSTLLIMPYFTSTVHHDYIFKPMNKNPKHTVTPIKKLTDERNTPLTHVRIFGKTLVQDFLQDVLENNIEKDNEVHRHIKELINTIDEE